MTMPWRILLTLALGAGTSVKAQERAIVIRGGIVITMAGTRIPNGTVVMQGGKIVAVGANVSTPAGADIVDATGKYVMPGIIDAATHIGLGGNDLNEGSDPMTPQSRVIEAYNPFGEFGGGKPGPLRNHENLSGGVTTMYVAPADRAVLGGQGVVVKTAGPNLDGVILREPAGLNMVLGEPPKEVARSKNRDPFTRMAEVAMLRQLFIKAQEYQKAKGQNSALPRDLGLEAVGRVLTREIPARIEANTSGDIRSALRLSQEFGFDLVVDGGAWAYQMREELASRKVPVVLGQMTTPFVSNEEIPDRTDYPTVDERTPARLLSAGVKVAIATFSASFGSLAPGGQGKWLLIDAAVAGGYGMSDEDVLRAVTINAAEILGVANRVGSLTPGKDADVLVLSGDPLSIKTWVERVYVNGELVHEKGKMEKQ